MTTLTAPHAPRGRRTAGLRPQAASGRALAELRRAGEENSTAELQAPLAAPQGVRDAWAERVEHTAQTAALSPR